jgi:hypothetical protein
MHDEGPLALLASLMFDAPLPKSEMLRAKLGLREVVVARVANIATRHTPSMAWARVGGDGWVRNHRMRVRVVWKR